MKSIFQKEAKMKKTLEVAMSTWKVATGEAVRYWQNMKDAISKKRKGKGMHAKEVFELIIALSYLAKVIFE